MLASAHPNVLNSSGFMALLALSSRSAVQWFRIVAGRQL